MPTARPGRPRVEGSCGQPVDGVEVRLVSPETGLDVPVGAEGEVWVRGPSVMLGYHGLPEVTAAALRDGCYRTGDLARFDADGNLFVTGRHRELVIRGGEKIHPAEVEDVLRAVPGVADVAVTGRPHDVLGELPVAFVVPGPEGFDPRAAYAACRGPARVPQGARGTVRDRGGAPDGVRQGDPAAAAGAARPAARRQRQPPRGAEPRRLAPAGRAGPG
ncbi:fatty acid--CoA ligase family protein [Micromonospora olivasterospora]